MRSGISASKTPQAQRFQSPSIQFHQAERLLDLPASRTKKGKRDRALLALLVGCGLRRQELAGLRIEDIQQRDSRWCIVDLAGKGIESLIAKQRSILQKLPLRQ